MPAIDTLDRSQTMHANLFFPADGEKLSAEQIDFTYVPPPGVDSFFRRSTLLIGARGVGKTFLLRHRKRYAHPGAVYINLVKCLQSLSRDSGLGGRALNYTDTQRAQIRAKTAALIALTTVQQLLTDDRWAGSAVIRLERLVPLLPSGIPASGVAGRDSVTALRRRVNQERLGNWTNCSIVDSWLLAEVLGEIGGHLQPQLCFFFDRAEDAPGPSLQILLPLLDQSMEYLTVIAARPGLAQLVPDELDPTLVPGDHFDIVHLGMNPYDPAWISFSSAATGKYLDANGVDVQDDGESPWSSRLARDSIRSAVNLAQIGLATRDDVPHSRSRSVRALRDHQLSTIKAALQPEHADFASTVRLIRQRCRADLARGGQRVVLIDLAEPEPQLSLVRQRGQVAGFLLKALRCEALYLPPGHLWHPFELPETYELPPILAWDGENTEWIT